MTEFICNADEIVESSIDSAGAIEGVLLEAARRAGSMASCSPETIS